MRDSDLQKQWRPVFAEEMKKRLAAKPELLDKSTLHASEFTSQNPETDIRIPQSYPTTPCSVADSHQAMGTWKLSVPRT